MSEILDRGMTEAQARRQLYREDVAHWYPGKHAHNAFSVMSPRDGHEVARCDRRHDRDAVLAMARSHDALVDALEMIRDADDDCRKDSISPRLSSPARCLVDAAIKLAGR